MRDSSQTFADGILPAGDAYAGETDAARSTRSPAPASAAAHTSSALAPRCSGVACQGTPQLSARSLASILKSQYAVTFLQMPCQCSDISECVPARCDVPAPRHCTTTPPACEIQLANMTADGRISGGPISRVIFALRDRKMSLMCSSRRPSYLKKWDTPEERLRKKILWHVWNHVRGIPV